MDSVRLEIKSTLTTNILLKESDGTYYTNVYGEMACFIGTATLIDDNNKKVKYIRFESDPFNKETKGIDLHKMWLEFDNKIQAYAKTNQHEFIDCNIYQSTKIKIL